MSHRTVVCVCVCLREGRRKARDEGEEKREEKRSRDKSIAYNKKNLEETHLLLCFLEYRRYTKSI